MLCKVPRGSFARGLSIGVSHFGDFGCELPELGQTALAGSLDISFMSHHLTSWCR